MHLCGVHRVHFPSLPLLDIWEQQRRTPSHHHILLSVNLSGSPKSKNKNCQLCLSGHLSVSVFFVSEASGFELLAYLLLFFCFFYPALYIYFLFLLFIPLCSSSNTPPITGFGSLFFSFFSPSVDLFIFYNKISFLFVQFCHLRILL